MVDYYLLAKLKHLLLPVTYSPYCSTT